MSKRMTKVLSMILTLVMFLSVSTPAFAWGNIGIGEGWDRDIGEDEVRDFDVDVEEEKEEYDYFSTFDEETGINVTVEAPMGALPTLAEVRVEPVDPEAVREAVDSVTEGEREILLAMDISFWLEDDEIEPEEPVRVRIAAPELEGRSDLTVVHIPDEEEPESIDLITDENDLKFELGTNEICFESGDFSIYAVVGDHVISDSSRLTVNFIRKIGDKETVITTVYVKNSDKYLAKEEDRVEGESYINDIVFDPGLGDGYQLGTNMFRGWTIDAADANPDDGDPDTPNVYGANYDRNTKVYTIDDIDKFLAEKRVGSIAEGDVLNVYAMIFQTYTIAYYGLSTDISMGMHTVFAPLNENAQAPYTIDMTYTPEDNEHFFEGWKILEGEENIVSATAPDGTVITGRIPITDEDPDADPPVAATVFPDKTKLVVTGDVSFTVSQPAGHWLIFKENGKGARFNAPQFVKNGETTFQPTNALPANMTRNGYDFAGWYEVEVTYDAVTNRAIPVTDAQGDYVFKSDSPYVFGQTINKETIIAAKWTPRANSQYTVIIWQQKPSGEGYAFKESIPFTGTTGTAINVITQDGATVVDVDEDGNPRSTKNVKVNGTEKAYEGFHVGSFDTGKTIAAEGNTVVNVYYDRNIVTVNFNLYSNGSSGVVPVEGAPDWSSGTTYYVEGSDGYFHPLAEYTVNGTTGRYYPQEIAHADLVHSTGVNDSYDNTVYRYFLSNYEYHVYWNGSYWVEKRSGSSTTYNLNDYPDDTVYELHADPGGPYYYVPPAGWYKALTVYGRYGAKFTDGGYNWPTAYWWYSSYTGSNGNYSGSGTRTTFLDTFTPTTPQSMTINFYGFDPPSNANNHVYFYQEKADGSGYEVIDTVSVNHPANTNTRFNLSDKYTGFECVSWSFDGITWNTVGDKVDDGNGDYYYDAYPNQSGYQNILYTADLHIRYDRLTFPISYFDGTYFDGNNNVLKDVDKMSGFGVVEDIMYGSDISTYGQRYLEDGTTPNPNYNLPTREGYVFEGWYADETCSTPYDFDEMPYGGVTVFAKWRKVQYRVFLRTNVPTSDGSLDWGSEDQSMNFRITEGDYVSLPTGTRNGYIFVGWYYDEDFDDAFNSEVVPLTSDNVTDDYDKTVRLYMTDNAKMITKPDGTQDNKPINKWGFLDDDDAGINKDVKRFWITNKLDLYAKWKAVLDGAEGISVLYDEVPKGDDANASGHGVTGSAPTDGNRLYEDKSKAIAQPASTALAEDEHFLYWVVQTWDKTANNGEGAYVDVKVDGDIIKVYPGDNFMVRADYARITPDPDHAGKNFYTVQLRAAYGKKDGPEPTHIKWYSNIYDVAGNQFIDTETKGDMIHPTDATWNENGGWYIKQEDVQINRAVPIPAPPYSMEGYTFLGWGRGCDPDSVPEGGKAYVTDPSTLTEEDLYIKWVPAANNIPAHYEAMLPAAAASGNVVPGNTRADGEELTWQTVQYVAADEQKPYHDMYAIWGGEFKVYHSGIEGGAVETYSLSRDNKTFDLTRYYTNTRAGGDEHTGEYKNKGFLYGGYYLEGGFKPAAYTEKTVGEGDAQKTIYIPTSTCAAYDGTNWTWTTPVTDQPGNAITPKGGVTYYIKEVPADKYLQPYFHYTYKKAATEGGDEPIVTAWLISDIDDTTYTDTGFIFVDQNGQAKVCSSLTVQNANGGNTIKLTPKRIFGGKGVTGGLLTYRRVINNYAAENSFGSGTVLQYWVTPDGLYVTGIASRTYSGITLKGTIACSETKVPSTISDSTDYTILKQQTD